MDLNNKVIAITGAAQGLGLAMTKRLIQQGATVVAIDLNRERLNETAKSFSSHPNAFIPYSCNIANETEVNNLFTELSQDFPNLHGLVNNAGIVKDALLIKVKDGELQSKMSLNDWQSVIDVNLTGVFLCTREAAALMSKNQTPGVIVNISSISRGGNIGQTNYSAAKAGVSAMTITWAKELIKYGIRVAAIAPGFIETELTQKIKASALEKVTAMIPSKRLGQPDEIAQVVQMIFENDYITGRTIECDGGLRL